MNENNKFETFSYYSLISSNSHFLSSAPISPSNYSVSSNYNFQEKKNYKNRIKNNLNTNSTKFDNTFFNYNFLDTQNYKSKLRPYSPFLSYFSDTSTNISTSKIFELENEKKFPNYPKNLKYSQSMKTEQDSKEQSVNLTYYNYLVSPIGLRKVISNKTKSLGNKSSESYSSPKLEETTISKKSISIKNSNLKKNSYSDILSKFDLMPNDQDYSLIKEIREQFLKCKICFYSFSKPRTLSCLHTFCENCLHKENLKSSLKNKIVCPVCDKKTDIPLEGVGKLPESQLLSNLKQVVVKRINNDMMISSGPKNEKDLRRKLKNFKKFNSLESDELSSLNNLIEKSISSEEEEPKFWCQICNSSKNLKIENICEKQNAENFVENEDKSFKNNQRFTKKEALFECLDCSAILLCENCASMHRVAEITKVHSLVAVDWRRKGRLQCERHQSEMIRYFCESCDICICVLCAFNKHKTHKIVTFSEGIKTQLQNLQDKFTICKTNCQIIRKQLELINNFENKISEVENLIKKKTNESIIKIKEKEEEILKKLKSTTLEKEVSGFLDQKIKMKNVLESVNTTFSLTEELLNSKNLEIFLMKNTVEEKMKDLLEWVVKIIPDQVKQPPYFFPYQENEMGIGFFESNNFDTSKNSNETIYSDTSHSCSEPKSNKTYSTSESKVSERMKSSSQIGKETNSNHESKREVKKFDKCIQVIEEKLNLEYQEKFSQTDNLLVLKEKNLSEIGVNTKTIKKIDKSNITPKNKQKMVNKGISTVSQLMVDKTTSTSTTTVSSAYKELVENKLPKLLMVNRGTITIDQKLCKFEGYWKKHSENLISRSTSPIKLIRCDKGVMANKAELNVDKEIFQKAGMTTKPKKILDESFTGSVLDSINEGSEEESEIEEENRIFSKNFIKNSSLIEKEKTPLKSFSSFRTNANLKSKLNSAVVYPMNQNFKQENICLISNKISNQSNKKILKDHIEIGINTNDVGRLDKSTGTDSPPVVEKMAECINKLKTVRHRLECLQGSQNSSDSMESSGKGLIENSINLIDEYEDYYDLKVSPKLSFDDYLSNSKSLINPSAFIKHSLDKKIKNHNFSNQKKILDNYSVEIQKENLNDSILRTDNKNKKHRSPSFSPSETKKNSTCVQPSSKETVRKMVKKLPSLKEKNDPNKMKENLKSIFNNSISSGSCSSSYNSSESSNNNSPNIQRSYKLTESNKFSNQMKPQAEYKKNYPKTKAEKKFKNIDKNESIILEKKEENDKMIKYQDGLKSFSASIKQRLLNHSSKKTGVFDNMHLKPIPGRHKSPRPTKI